MKLRERMDKLKKKQKGFTLVELIVVIAIIGILAGVMLPRFFGFTDDARVAAAIAEAKSIRAIAETYYASSDEGEWSAVSAATGSDFQVQTGGDSASPDYDNSPTFTGEIKQADGSDFSADEEIDDGAFQYEKNGVTVTCDENGNVTD